MLLREGSPGEPCPRDGSNGKVVRPFRIGHLASAGQILITVSGAIRLRYGDILILLNSYLILRPI